MTRSMSKAHTIMDKWGYTGSACISMALDDAARQGKLKPGEVIILCGSGGGIALSLSGFLLALMKALFY